MPIKYKSGDLAGALWIIQNEGYSDLTRAEQASLAGQLVVASAIRELIDRMDDIERKIDSVKLSVESLPD
jgi:hypothetical protein